MTFDFQDGWTLYVWLVSGALILIAVVFGIRWAANNEQFDEDIKYLVFDEGDRDKMTPEEFKKMQEVTKYQEDRRERLLREAEEDARLG